MVLVIEAVERVLEILIEKQETSGNVDSDIIQKLICYID